MVFIHMSWGILSLKTCRYFLRVTIVRRLTDMTKELDLAVHTLATYPEMNNPIKMEVCGHNFLHSVCLEKRFLGWNRGMSPHRV